MLFKLICSVLVIVGMQVPASAGSDETHLFPITEFVGVFPQGGVKGGFIDEKGTVVMAPTGEIMPPVPHGSDAYFVEGLQPVSVQLKSIYPPLSWGYLDTKCQFAIKPQFEGASPFSEGLASVSEKVVPWKRGYIDHTGKFVIPPQFRDAGPFHDGLALVRKEDDVRAGFIDKNGRWVVPPTYPAASNFSEGLASVGRPIKEPAEPTPPSENPSELSWGYIDKTGAVVIDFKFKSPSEFSEELAAINDDGACGYIDKSGRYAIEPRFRMGWSFSEGLARVVTKEKGMAYIDKKGEIVFSVPQVSWADPFSEGLANAAVPGNPHGRLYGFLDHTGTFVIKPQFPQAAPFRNGLALVTLGDEYGYIDKSGNFVWKSKVPAWPK